ncbi:hypothetical protein PEC301899_40320 [Pectobacterium carotovorum subsp. carotovorum]|nr:hypothetical protein PEC301899_40320 [Pectobacterium carotovorum subsp. carotovorum]
MSDDNLAEEVYFKMVCDFLRDNNKWYLKRFGYAACELWLCSEICNILNFDHDLSFNNTEEDKICFNEDKKRDLTVYESSSDKILSHIEVKLLYPSYTRSKRKEKMYELEKKLSRDMAKPGDSGWIFMIWTSANHKRYIDRNAFFDESISDINEYINESHMPYAVSQLDVINIFDDEFDWRRGKKRLTVKAIAINHIIDK